MIKIDWDKESPKVKEASDEIMHVYELYGTMNPEEQKRFQELIDILLPD